MTIIQAIYAQYFSHLTFLGLNLHMFLCLFHFNFNLNTVSVQKYLFNKISTLNYVELSNNNILPPARALPHLQENTST